MNSKSPRIIISGGGTGGHIFPAISIANAIKALRPEAEILFVGAEGRMEMQRVPDAGYPIKGLPVMGFDRKHLWKNVVVLYKLMRSQCMAKQIIREFKPHVAVGVGGYASGPLLRMAGKMGIPTLIQEQNSYAGVTNKLLAKQADVICVAYEGMERFFPQEKLVMTGNPVRQNLLSPVADRAEAVDYFHLDPSKKTILVLGGRLGARTINLSLQGALDTVKERSDVQWIWQTGKIYIDQMREAISQMTGDKINGTRVTSIPNLYVTDFIKDMSRAYAAADLVISRAGAGSISEFCLLHKPVILVPSPNVAEDHQTKNALALLSRDAALMVKDVEAPEKLVAEALQVVGNPERLQELSAHIAEMALPHSADTIAGYVLDLIEKKGK